METESNVKEKSLCKLDWFMLALTLCAQFGHKPSVLAPLSANMTFDLVLIIIVGAPVSLWELLKICVKLIYMKAIEWPQSPTETVYGLRRTYQHCRAVYDVIY